MNSSRVNIFVLSGFLILAQLSFGNNIYAQKQSAGFSDQIRIPAISITGYGLSAGINQGHFTSFEIGIEKYWKQVKLLNPRTTAISANIMYYPWQGVAGLSSNFWMRKSRYGLTYGASGAYFNDFETHSRVAIGPTLGWRFLGLHIGAGYNLLIGDKELTGVNSLYFFGRYYLPRKRDLNFK
jgi:hypothetical protein